MSDDGVLYTYVNVGLAPPAPADSAVLFTYVNVGFQLSPSVIGRIRGFAGLPLLTALYTYVNVGGALPASGSRITEDTQPRVTQPGDRRITDGV